MSSCPSQFASKTGDETPGLFLCSNKTEQIFQKWPLNFSQGWQIPQGEQRATSVQPSYYCSVWCCAKWILLFQIFFIVQTAVYGMYIYVYIYIYIYIYTYIYIYIYIYMYILYTMGRGRGVVAHVLWQYCMRLASSGVGGVRRVRLASLYVGSCVGVLWMMFWMRLASSGVWGGVHQASGAVRRLAAPAARRQHPMTLAACNIATRHVPPALALAP